MNLKGSVSYEGILWAINLNRTPVSFPLWFHILRHSRTMHAEFPPISPGGETGRRKGLKIPRWQHCAGSIPAPGTIYISISYKHYLITILDSNLANITVCRRSVDS